MNRTEILKKANECVTGYRQEDYGNPEDNFKLIATLWEPYIRSRCVFEADVCIEPQDVAILMSLLKIARIATGTQTEDSFVDACGYLACAGEIAGEDTNVPTKEMPKKDGPTVEFKRYPPDPPDKCEFDSKLWLAAHEHLINSCKNPMEEYDEP